MSCSASPDERLKVLVDRICDGLLTQREVAELESLLLDNPKAQRRYQSLVRLDGCLRREFRRQKQNAAPLPPSLAVLSAQATGNPLGYSSPSWPMAYLVATMVMVCGLVVLSYTYVSHPSSPVRQPKDGFVRTAPNAPKATVVGQITGIVDCEWERPGFRGQGSEAANQKSEIRNQESLIHLGDRLALRSGLLEITYDTGAKVILQGPVTYEVDSAAGGYLAIGKLTARLEKKPEVSGQRSAPANQKSEIRNQKSPDLCPLTSDLFAIRTPTAVVTDLGTEFGVEVNDEGATDTRVFTGRVQVAVTSANGNGQTQVISAGQSAHVGKDLTLSTDLRDSQAHAKRFVRSMPDSATTSDAYGKLVLSMNPVVYYRMDHWPKDGKTASYVLVDSAPGGRHGVAHADEAFGKPACRGRFGKALDRHGSMADKEYAVVNDYPKTTNGQISVSAWVWSVVLDPWATIVANWHNTPTGEEVGQFALGVDFQARLTAQLQQPDGKMARIVETGNPMPRSEWQHVAMVADGAVLRLYRNGEEVGSMSYQGITQPLSPKCLSVGCSMRKDGVDVRPEQPCLWNGRLDEIAIFNHALSVEQVRQLCAGRAAELEKKKR